MTPEQPATTPTTATLSPSAGTAAARAPLVSIVLPTYNGARYLALSLESVLAQTYENFELIVVDDTSSDRTPEIIAEFAARDPRVRAVRNPVNLRLPASLNVGFSNTRGEYLTWTSDDNLYRPRAIEVMSSFLNAHPDVGMVYTDATWIDDEGRTVGKYRVHPPDDLAWGNVVGASFMYRRSARDAVGDYAEDRFLTEDWDYWFRISTQTKLAPLHEDLYLYRQHGGSLSQTKAQAVLDTAERQILDHLKHEKSAVRGTQASGWAALAEVSLKSGRRGEALRRLGRAARLAPLRVLTRHPRVVSNTLLGATISKGVARARAMLKGS